MKRKFGFTLVEVLTVIVVISIIVGIASVAFANQQKLTRDSKRRVDMLALATEMESYFRENGNYPLTCGFGSGAVSSCTATIVTSSYSGATISPLIQPTTTFAQLKALFPNIDDGFGDPRSTFAYPLNQYVSSQVPRGSYFLFSSDMVSTSSTPQSGGFRFENQFGGYFSCNYYLQPVNSKNDGTARRPHRFVVGFYSEEANAWRFYINRDREELNAISWGSTDPNNVCYARSIDELKAV